MKLNFVITNKDTVTVDVQLEMTEKEFKQAEEDFMKVWQDIWDNPIRLQNTIKSILEIKNENKRI